MLENKVKVKRIFIDMDGVLTDFALGVENMIGMKLTSDDAAHRARGTGSFGHDYAPAGGGGDGMGIFLTNGARIVENYVDNSPEGQGSNRMVIELPNGKRYAFVHGTAAKGVKSNV